MSWVGKKVQQLNLQKSNYVPPHTLQPVDSCSTVFGMSTVCSQAVTLGVGRYLMRWGVGICQFGYDTHLPLKQPVQELQFRCLMCLLSLNRFPTCSASPMADHSCRSPLGILAVFSHRLMQSATGAGRWAGVWCTEESGGLARSLSAFAMAFWCWSLFSWYFDLGEDVAGNLGIKGEAAALVEIPLPRGVKKGTIKTNSFLALALL